MNTYKKSRGHQEGLFQSCRHTGPGFCGSSVHCLLQLLLLDPLQVCKQDDKEEFHPRSGQTHFVQFWLLSGVPLFGHHEQALHQEAFHDLRANALE